MRQIISAMLCGSAIWVGTVAAPAFAQSTDERREERIEQNIADIVVTARRKEEQIQDVPQAIQAVSGATLEKLNLFSFEDLSKIAAGISLSRAGGITTVRGVSFNPTAQTNPTVSMYINDAPVQPTLVFQSVFDVDQFQILRGPQGTLRGQSAPTGAITIGTRKPNLYRHGATAMATFTDRDGRTLQGAANIPIIEGVLGVRFAGMADHNNNGGIRSVNSVAADGSLNKPYSDTNAFRASVRFEPTDSLSANFMYQNLFTRSRSFGAAVFGNGAPAASIRASNSPYALPFVRVAGSNGPVINEGDRFSVAENADFSRAVQEIATGQVEYGLAGQKLSFVGAWSRNKGLTSDNYGDTPNLIRGDFPGRSNISNLNRWSQELRLSSEEYLFNGLLEYVIGAFHQVESGGNDGNNGLTFLSGAFGSPLGAPVAQTPNLDFSTTSLFKSTSRVREWSYFGTLTLHFGENTELSGGIRFMDVKKDAVRVNSQTGGYQATAACPAGSIPNRTYAGVCDLPVASRISGTVPDNWHKKPTVYSASLSHRWTPDLLTYFNFGTSWRPGPTQGNLINGQNDPTLTALSMLKDETTKSFEVGIKSSWFDRRLNLNIAAFHQKYDNYVYSVLTGIPYLTDTGVPGTTPSVSLAIPMNSNIDAQIDGVDFDFQFAASKSWNIGGGVSWAYGRFKDALIPCWDGDFNGTPDVIGTVLVPGVGPALFQNAGVYIAQCRTSGRSALQPTWNATLRSDYTRPVSDDIDAFISGTMTYTPKNPYPNPSYVVPNYALVNLNIGVRDYKAGWEFQLFARNLFNNQAVLDKSVSALTSIPDLNGTFGASGYRGISYLAPRELGLTLRYAFGSR